MLFSVFKLLLDFWVVDGVIEICLEFNILIIQFGSFVINVFCNFVGIVQVNFIFLIVEFNDLCYEYWMNNNFCVLVDFIVFVMVILFIGENIIIYYILDCVGNIDSCVQ